MSGAPSLGAFDCISTRRLVAIVVLVAFVVRAWCAVSLPLVVTPDGVAYVDVARRLIEDGSLQLPHFRTPGYHLFLAGVFGVFGVGPVPVLIAQHLLGCVTAALVCGASCRLASRRLGFAAGLACALDPWLLGYESYALSETLMTTAVVAAVVAALAPGPDRRRSALLLGGLLGVACVVRPTAEVLIPFLGAGWLVPRHVSWKRTGGLALAMALGLAVVTAPWLAFNARRGVTGLAAGSGPLLWSGLARVELLDPTYPLDEPTSRAFEPIRHGFRNDSALWAFFDATGAMTPGPAAETLGAWAWSSIGARPWDYAKQVGVAVAWQLDATPARSSEMRWSMTRLGEDATRVGNAAPNFQFSGRSTSVSGFEMAAPRGVPARLYRSGVPHVADAVLRAGLLLAALVVVVVAPRAGRVGAGVASVFAGTIAFSFVHALMLQPPPRYSLPVWITWYVAAAIALDRLRVVRSITPVCARAPGTARREEAPPVPAP